MADDHTLVYLLLDLAIIVVAARSAGWLAAALGQPRVIGEIFAGLLLGPTVLGRIWPDGPREIFPPDVPLQSLADLGLIIFMFQVGLDMDARTLRAERRGAFAVGAAGFVVPAVLGLLAGLALFPVNEDGAFPNGVAEGGRLTFALFLAAAMSITAFPVLARILIETGLAPTRVGVVALAAAALGDVGAWVLLAGVVGVARNGAGLEAVRALVLTAVFVAGMLLVVRPLLAALAAWLEKVPGGRLDYVALVLAGLFLSALATQQIGVHVIIGAFLFGAVAPRPGPGVTATFAPLQQFTTVALLPVFFVVTGLRTDLFAIDRMALLGWLALLFAVAASGKLLGCGLAARASGFSRRDSATLGVLMNARGLTELVVLNVGLSIGVLSGEVFAIMVVVALVTTVMTAPVVRLIRRGETIGIERKVLVPP